MDDNVFHNSVLAVPIGESIGRQPFEGWISVLETFGGQRTRVFTLADRSSHGRYPETGKRPSKVVI